MFCMSVYGVKRRARIGLSELIRIVGGSLATTCSSPSA
jgi:hypothetical protein